MSLALESYIAFRYIQANVKQSCIIALAVGVGVAIIIFIPSINMSFFDDLLNKTVENAPHIKVTQEQNTTARNQKAVEKILSQALLAGKPQVLLTNNTEIRRRNIQSYPRLIREIKGISGVQEVAPTITQQIIIVRGSKVRGAALRGIVPELERRITRIESDVQVGRLTDLNDSNVMLGWRLAEELGVGVGNRINLVTPYANKSFKINGLLKSGVASADLDSVVVSLHTAQQILKMPNEVNTISVRVNDIYDADRIATQISQSYAIKAKSWMEENEVFLEQIANFRTIFGFISFMIILSAASSITSVLIMVVAAKSKEIGILKSMGVSNGGIVRVFLIQALFLSVLGAIAGIFLGYGFISLYNASPMATAKTFIGMDRQPARMNLEFTLRAVFYALLSSFFASLIPAWQAGRLDPVKNINQ